MKRLIVSQALLAAAIFAAAVSRAPVGRIIIAALSLAALLLLFIMYWQNKKGPPDETTREAAPVGGLEAANVKNEFIVGISHEIRTPLNAIIGMSELLSMERMSNRQMNYVKDIGMASHLLLSIINDMLDFSKIEAGKFTLSPVNYDFRDLVAGMVSMFKYIARKKGLEFGYEAKEGLPKCLYGDDARLRQVLANIFSNAVNYTPRGRIHFAVEHTGGEIMFRIDDTGIGINPADREALFTPFMRAGSVLNRGVNGAGLGLPLSKSIIEMMGGSISVESEFGKGSAFTVAIPKVPGDESGIAVRGGVPVDSPIGFRAPDARALVVDDNNLNLKVAFRLLSLYGITVDMASSGFDAMSAVRGADYDIVFMDHMMPDMDGIQTTLKIRDMDEKYRSLPVIALTANAAGGVRDIFLANGLDDYLPKPVELCEMDKILRKWLPVEKIENVSYAIPDKIAAQPDARPGGAFAGFREAVTATGLINAETGMARVAGIEEMYREMLDLFYNRLPGDIDKLKTFRCREDMGSFAIFIHGMKSSLATVGALGLSEAAAELEKAARENDKTRCEAGLTPFIKSMRELQSKLGAVCERDPAAEDKPAGSEAYLKKYVRAALDAAEDYNTDAGIEITGKLLEYDFGGETNRLLKFAQDAFRGFESAEAADYLRQAL